MADTPRSEDEILSELEQLCASAGYIHVFAALVVQNTFVAFAEGIKGEDFHKTFEKDHLVRTELCTLFGLMVKHPIVYSVLTMERMSELGTRTLQLLEELHASLGGPPLTPPADGNFENFEGIDFSLGSALREPIFYTGESAYSFQYRDIAPVKYANDDPWMQVNRGFTIAQAACVGKAILALEQERLMILYNSLRSGIPGDFTFLPGFTFTPDELLEGSGESKATIISVLDSFSIRNGDKNATFKTLNDFNIVNAQPILCKEPGTYILFQAYSFYEALYESPFYWMLQDPTYKDLALGHRGSFTEEFSANCLGRVFAKKYVHANLPAVGQRFIVSAHLTEVVGVVEDGKYHDLEESPQPVLYQPFSQAGSGDAVFVVRSQRAPSEMTAALRGALSSIAPNAPINIQSWVDSLDNELLPARAATTALGAMGLLAAMLAVTGIFGMAAYNVSKRMKELGIRVALGARKLHVMNAAVGRPMFLLCVGSALGLLAGLFANRLLGQIVYQADPRDPLVVGGAVLTMALLGIAASAIPARRALSVDPSKLMREE